MTQSDGIKCKNPKCNTLIQQKVRRNNIDGLAMYCSVECYAKFTPCMEKIGMKWLVPGKDAYDSLQEFITKVESKKLNLSVKASMLSISRETYKLFRKKLLGI
jgi:hypothetical protein